MRWSSPYASTITSPASAHRRSLSSVWIQHRPVATTWNRITREAPGASILAGVLVRYAGDSLLADHIHEVVEGS